MERGLSILWIDAICGSVQNSMTPPEKNVVRRVGKPTLYERGCHRPIFPHHWLRQRACCQSATSGPHRGAFNYVLPCTDLLGWTIERASGLRQSFLDFLWMKLG